MHKLFRRTPLAVTILLVAVALGSGYLGVKVGIRYEKNQMCCELSQGRMVRLAFREALGLANYSSQIGQDKWVLETVFPDIVNGFFVDIGSADGTYLSNTRALERRGWTGICIDPFPTNMQDRTCQMLKEVVFSEPGQRVSFQTSGELGGIADTLGLWKDRALKAPTVELTTTTLSEILERTKAPGLIHFMSLDIEGAELEALKGFPLDTHTFGALAVEHNYEEPKRTEMAALLQSHGYRRSHTWQHDDFYLPDRR